jgi:mono/diheme cytochrome c family protein
MDKYKVAVLTAVLVSLLFLVSAASWAQDEGAALYKSNCATCHKADASGNPAMKSPALKGKSLADVNKAIQTGPKHAALKSKLNDSQLQAIAGYLKNLK